MSAFVGKGQDIARALDNALLFCDPKAEYLPGVVLIEFSPAGIAFAACDDYATGYDSVGELGVNIRQDTFVIYEHEADELVKLVRSAKTKAVTLAIDTADPDSEAAHLVVTLGDTETRFMLAAPAEAWDNILPLMDPSFDVPDRLPATVAFNAARFAKFGRVKGAKDAPMDIRFHPTEGAPIALIKVGPTFRGELQGVRRSEALRALGEGAQACFWPDSAGFNLPVDMESEVA